MGAAGISQFQTARLRAAGMLPNPWGKTIEVGTDRPNHFIRKNISPTGQTRGWTVFGPGPTPHTLSTLKAAKAWAKTLPKNYGPGHRDALRRKNPRKKSNPRLKAVPKHLKESKRGAPYVYPKRKSYPINNLFHARLALIYVMSPTNAPKRKKVINAVADRYPQYNWAAWWNREIKDPKKCEGIKKCPLLKTWSHYRNGGGRGSWEQDDPATKHRNPGKAMKRRKNKKLTFKDVKVGDGFTAHGESWIKRSTRTATIWGRPKTKYRFKDKEAVEQSDYEEAIGPGGRIIARKRNPTKRKNSRLSDEARELSLYIENDEPLYAQRGKYIITTLAKKMANGTFDKKMAVVAFKHLADDGAKKYSVEHGTPQRGVTLRNWGRYKGFGIFTPEVRRETAKELLDGYMDHIEWEAREIKSKKKSKNKSSSRRNPMLPKEGQIYQRGNDYILVESVSKPSTYAPTGWVDIAFPNPQGVTTKTLGKKDWAGRTQWERLLSPAPNEAGMGHTGMSGAEWARSGFRKAGKVPAVWKKLYGGYKKKFLGNPRKQTSSRRNPMPRKRPTRRKNAKTAMTKREYEIHNAWRGWDGWELDAKYRKYKKGLKRGTQVRRKTRGKKRRNPRMSRSEYMERLDNLHPHMSNPRKNSLWKKYSR